MLKSKYVRCCPLVWRRFARNQHQVALGCPQLRPASDKPEPSFTNAQEEKNHSRLPSPLLTSGAVCRPVYNALVETWPPIPGPPSRLSLPYFMLGLFAAALNSKEEGKKKRKYSMFSASHVACDAPVGQALAVSALDQQTGIRRFV
ncbi:uncharacterized protein UV8b_02894 [Ustilaginoidea virens]|uniref:Uncharacterized protein n=1 Tax=Ustilaginoidea virens TaxID=1159556 RepID=A0A8E5HNS8_USTVR|nr:uncharacterized protein UV8b_02894 [Ustilaginoidea virens]QUC18653.1 hypothetical protein UV8b_02894 [Ustilaginoidea virens]